LSSLNHLTVPVAIFSLTLKVENGAALTSAGRYLGRTAPTRQLGDCRPCFCSPRIAPS
jgi:hypothetical protein